MKVADVIEALKAADLGLSVSVEGKEAVSVKLVGKKIDIDVKDPVSLGKIIKKLK